MFSSTYDVLTSACASRIAIFFVYCNIFFLRGIGVYTLVLISNGDFAPLFRTL